MRFAADRFAAAKWLQANPPRGFVVMLAPAEKFPPKPDEPVPPALTEGWQSLGDLASHVADLALQRMRAAKEGKKERRRLKASAKRAKKAKAKA